MVSEDSLLPDADKTLPELDRFCVLIAGRYHGIGRVSLLYHVLLSEFKVMGTDLLRQLTELKLFRPAQSNIEIFKTIIFAFYVLLKSVFEMSIHIECVLETLFYFSFTFY